MVINQMKRFWRILILVMFFLIGASTHLFADVMIDNGDFGTSSTGTWKTSGGSNPYGTDSLFARPGATYTWQFDSQPTGQYEVLMWWTYTTTRGSGIIVDINAGTYHTVSINQLENGGKWNSLGTYSFNSSGNVTITASTESLPDGRAVSTCADAVWFRQISANISPVAYIDSISPNPARSGEEIFFSGHGEDDDGFVALYAWVSDIDGMLSSSPTFSLSSLSDGIHEISLSVQDNEGTWSAPETIILEVGYIPIVFIIDDGDPKTSYSGNWKTSAVSDWYDTNSLYSKEDGDTYTWTFSPGVSSDYEVSLWWTEYSNRDDDVPIAIEHHDGTDIVTIDQRENGGQWNIMGQYYFEAGSNYKITVTAQAGSSSTCADAVRFISVDTNQPPAATIVSILPNPADNGEAVLFEGSGHDPDGTVVGYAWRSNIDADWDNTSAFFSSDTLSEGIHEISFMVIDNQGRWSTPVTENLVVGTPPPTAAIDYITPNPATPDTSVTFSGHGDVVNGSITGYLWESSIDGELSSDTTFTTTLTQGTHIIYFTVFNGDEPSEPATQELTITYPEIIIDNGNAGTSFTGIWRDSSGSDPYGFNSFYARPEATYTWQFDSQPAGIYEVFLWWTETSSRGTHVEVDINGVDTVTINQLENGGQWNSIGRYFFNSNGSVTVIATGSTSTCADAAKFKFISSNYPPAAIIDEITPNPADDGEVITFSGSGDDSDGTIVAYFWESNLDGILNEDADSFSTTLSKGIHEIFFRVQDNEGIWSDLVSTTVTVGNMLQEVAVDNDGPSVSYTGTWYVSAAPDPYGNNSYYARDGATFTWKFTPLMSSDYVVSMWWTEYSNRNDNIPVHISYTGGDATVYIDQRENGGQWNFMGQYYFEAGNTYTVTIVAQPGPSSTCADSVKFTQVSNEAAPVANFGTDQRTGYTPFVVQFYDWSSGIVDDWLWNFGDGATSAEENPSHEYTAPGDYTVSLTVSNAYGSDTVTQQAYLEIYARENIYIGNSYTVDSEFVMGQIADALNDIGGDENNGIWTYTNIDKKITYIIQEVTTLEEWEQALKEEGSHVVFNGHSNYGLGSTWINKSETYDIQYFDDDLIFNSSTDMVDPDIGGMKYGQPYPNWEPVYQDGTSAIMPYEFGDPRGLPPYNYYLTYTLPGGTTHYKTEHLDGSYIARFPDSGKPAWYSPDGALPDPVENPEYFITNTSLSFNRLETEGEWLIDSPGDWHDAVFYMGHNFQYHYSGDGNNSATFYVVVQHPGMYAVAATWYPQPSNATNAQFTIQHTDIGTGEYDAVVVDQTASAVINILGVYYFTPGEYTVELTDDANGIVVADVVAFLSIDDPTSVTIAEFNTDKKAGAIPLSVIFVDYSTIYDSTNPQPIVTYFWDFGDGATSNQENPVHIFEAPGAYTVSLTITDELGNSDTEVKEEFIVIDGTVPVNAEFTAQNLVSSNGTTVNFMDQSSGNITQWHWDFGDGATSDEQNPTHTFTDIDSFTVTLSVTGPDGSDTETEVDFVYNVVGTIFVDNTFTTKPHYYRNYSGSVLGSVIMDASQVTISSEELKYSRMFYNGCYTDQYYLGKFNRGVVFYTIGGREQWHSPVEEYIKYYLLGASNDEMLEQMNGVHYIHGYYDFNKLPPSIHLPTANIVSIEPADPIAGQEVTFTGEGTDTDGTVTGYKWESNINGELSATTSFTTSSLSEGLHAITFTVYDNDGAASLPVTQTLTVTAATP